MLQPSTLPEALEEPVGGEPRRRDLGRRIAERHLELLISITRQLHEDGTVRRIFGRPIPVLIHERKRRVVALAVVAARPANLRVDPDRENPYSDQFIVQVEQGLMANLGLQVNYVHKRGDLYAGWEDITGQLRPGGLCR